MKKEKPFWGLHKSLSLLFLIPVDWQVKIKEEMLRDINLPDQVLCAVYKIENARPNLRDKRMPGTVLFEERTAF